MHYNIKHILPYRRKSVTKVITHKKSPNCYNKHQYKLIVLISTLEYVNKKHPKYTQSNILYYFNENLKRNGLAPVKLKTLQNYLYELEKQFKVTTNYHKHLGVNFGTEIYYQLNFSKKECHTKINKYFQEKKDLRYQKRVEIGLKEKFTKNGSVDIGECLSNKNNNIKEEEKKRDNPIKKFQIIKYFNKCNFLSKKFLFLLLNLNIEKDKLIKIFKAIKRYEIELTKNKKIFSNKPCFKEKQNKLKEILEDNQKEFEKKGYNPKQLETEFKKVYENYKLKPHFIIEYQKYNDLNKIKRKLEKSIELKKENPQKNYENLKINTFNILIERLKEKANIEFLKPIVKTYLNNKNKIEYKKAFGTYYYELLEIIEIENNSLKLKEFSKKVV
ncbi:plasmid maintenance protein [Borreliella japonica]|uniref:plasmid maintenance protein n=1 Tax=Borreliella japonica TaxID=34095 RepID=UPI003AEF7823